MPMKKAKRLTLLRTIMAGYCEKWTKHFNGFHLIKYINIFRWKCGPGSSIGIATD